MSGQLFPIGAECACGDINPPGARECDGCGRRLGLACAHCGDPVPMTAGRPRKFCGDACKRAATRPPVPVVVAPVVVVKPDRMRQWWLDQIGEQAAAELGREFAA